MALFRIEKGLAENLTKKRPNTVEGYCYFTIDDGKFYIDTETADGTAKRVALNAFKADKLSTARTIQLTGKVSGSASFDGSQDVTIAVDTSDLEESISALPKTASKGIEIVNNNIQHTNNVTAATASEGGSTRTLAFGGTFKVPGVTYDAQGHITGKSSVTLTLPKNPNTDTKVTSVDNHYSPLENDDQEISVDATGATTAASWNSTNLVTGVNVQRDAAGHVVGVTLDSVKMPVNPDTDTTYVLSGDINDDDSSYTITLDPSTGNNQTITIPAMGGANSTDSLDGTAGLVPAPAAANAAKFLRGDGTWATPTNTKTTAGAKNTSSKIFLIGATAQTTNPTTSSHDTVYVDTDGHLYDTGIRVSVEGHTHNYAGSSSAGGAATSANKVNESLSIKLNGGTTEGTNLFTFDGSTEKAINITPSAIGAAASSHGTHVNYGTSAQNVGSANSAGTASTVSRSDHVHALTKNAVTTALGYTPPTSDTVYTHPSGSASSKARGLYTFATDGTSHISEVVAVTKSDITALGIPGSDTNTAHSHTAGAGLTISGTGGTTGTTTYSLTASGVTAGTYGPSSAVTGNDAATIAVPAITVDEYGRITSIANKTYTSKNTTYSAGSGLSLSGTTFNHSNSITAKTTYEQNAAVTPGYSGTFKVYEPKYDAQGHITEVRASTVTMPSAQTIPTSFTITATATDDDVVVLTGTNGSNKVTFDAKHAKKGPTSGYTSSNDTTSVIGYGDSKTIKIPQITVDAYGHVTAASDESITITMPSAQTIPTSLKNPQSLKFGTQTYDGSAEKTITAADFGLSNALHFKGVLTSLPTATTNYVDGDVVLVGNKEYVVSNSTWVELGDESSFSLKDHTHNYAGSSSAGGAATSANKVNKSLTVKLNGGSTEGTDLFTFNGSATKSINITPSAIGAAASSHGTHVSYGTTATAVGSTASAGSATTVSRSDHTHSLSKSAVTTALGYTPPTSDTTYNIATASTDGLVPMFDAADGTIDSSSNDWVLTNNNGTIGWYKLPANAFKNDNTVYTHPSHTAKTSGLYKITVDSQGHVSAATAVAKSDITALGIPGSDTNTHYTTGITAGATGTTSNSATTNGNTYIKIKDDSTHRGQIKITGSGATTVTSDANGVITISSTDNNTVYTHPSHTAKSSGLYKITVDALGHVSAATAVAKSDITGLGIPGSDTNYYHTRAYSSGLKISTGTGVSDMYVPSATGTQSGVVIMHPASNCTTFTSDDSTCTVAAVKKAVTLFTNDYAPTKTGGGASGEWGISITGSAGSVAWDNITDKPSSFTPSSHSHSVTYKKAATTTGGTTQGGTVAKTSITPSGTISQPTFTGTKHSHTFTGTAHNHTFTGSSHGHTVTAPTDTVQSVSDVGAMFTATVEVENEVLVLTSGRVPAVESKTVVTSVTVAKATQGGTIGDKTATGTISETTATGTVSTPTFTGTAAEHNHTFTGSSHTHSITLTDTTVTAS